jgi:hypothetical protein
MKLRKLITMREALESDGYFGRLLGGESWASWRVLLIAIVGEALTEDERLIFTALTGREGEPLEAVEEFWAVIGRLGGKTRSAAALAAYIAGCVDHRETLAPGERGVLPILAASMAQAGQAFNFGGVFARRLDGRMAMDSGRGEGRLDKSARRARPAASHLPRAHQAVGNGRM